eukprot:jgi/Picre1/32524/NNA_007870.t1
MVLVRKAGSMHSAGSFDDMVDNSVADHYRHLGAILDARIGRACQHCIRGLISTKNIRQGDALFILPMKLVYFLNGEFTSDSQMGGKYLEIYAYNFAIDVFGSSAFNMTHKAWFESMQRNCRENIYRASESDLNLLEMPKLKQKFVQTTQSLKEMFEGTKFAGYASNDALNFVLEPMQISFEQFLDIAYMVQTRRMKLGSKQAMIPIFDFINNAETEQKANARFFNNQSHVGFLATKDIPDGTEIRWNYRGNQRTAPDEIFFIWQYITDEVDVLFAEDGSIC